MFRNSILHVLTLILLLAGACQSPEPKPIILVSKEYENRFKNWLAQADSTIERINMYTVGRDSIDHYLSLADGMIISGGPDINPALYGKESELARCGPIDHRRDTLELNMIRYAMQNGIPLLCICRGHQILNVANQGSLIIDIPVDYDTAIIHRTEGKHMVHIVEGTLLSEIIEPDSGLINSRHHQAVERIAPGFRAVAFAPDGIIEAIEPADAVKYSFILGLQWHPESMIEEPGNPFSFPVAARFMEEIHKYASKGN